MTIIDIVWSIRPESCGPLLAADYYRWKVYHQQLWRKPSPPVEVIPFKPIQRKLTHSTPARKRDLVRVGDEIGVINFISKSDNEASVYFFKSQTIDTFDLDSFESHFEGRIRWIVHVS